MPYWLGMMPCGTAMASERQSGSEAGGFGRAHSDHCGQLLRPGCGDVGDAAVIRQEPMRQCEGVLAGPPGTHQHGNQFGVGECVAPEPQQPLPGSLVGCNIAHPGHVRHGRSLA